MRRKHMGTLAAAGIVVLLASACSSSGNSPSSPNKSGSGGGNPYYAGKTIEIISTAGAGGGSDVAARIVAAFLTKYLPGNPKTKVVELAGGGGIQGANEFATRKSDGTHIMVTSSSATLPYILGTANVHYDFKKFRTLWEVPSAKVFFAASSTGVKTVADLAHPKTKLVAGGTAPGSTETDAEVIYDALGIYKNMKILYGYKDSKSVQDSIETGETNFSSYGVASFLRSYKDLVTTKKVSLIFDTGVPNASGGFDPDPNLPGVPTAAQAYKTLLGHDPSGDAWNAFVMLTNVHSWGLMTEADIPPAAATALDDAFTKMMTDPDYKAKMKPVTPYAAQVGADARKWGDQIGNLDPHLVSWLKSFISRETS